jgi:hypothetical protein
MLKPLTLSLSLAVALGLCSVSKAGLFDSNCATCGLASPQGVVASPQGYGGCAPAPCAPKHHFSLPRLKCCHSTSYEWVLKKKHHFSFSLVHPQHGCDPAPIYPTAQHIGPSGQFGGPSGQIGGPSGQIGGPLPYGAGQAPRTGFLPARSTTAIASAPAEMTPAGAGGEEVPPAPEVKGTTSVGSQNGLLLPTPSGN